MEKINYTQSKLVLSIFLPKPFSQKNMTLAESIRRSGAVVVLFWLVYGFERYADIDLNNYVGLMPRSFWGLAGILFSPFLHGDLFHLLSNSFPFILLGGGVLFFYPKIAYRAVIKIYLLTGLGVWLFARPSVHIGASGLVYGFGSFLFFSGVFRKDIRSLSIAVAVAVLYGGMVEGLLPLNKGVSWESHLIGAIIGLFTAFYHKNEIPETLPQAQSTDENTEIAQNQGFRNIENAHLKYYFEPKKS